MKQLFALALIAGACLARPLSGILAMKRLIVVATLAGLMSSAAHAQTLAQQRAMVTPQQSAVALKSSQEYLRAAGWRFQVVAPDGSSTWTNSDYGTVTLAKDGWLQLANGQKVRPERVGLYLQGLAQSGTNDVVVPPVSAPAPAPEPRYVEPQAQSYGTTPSRADWAQVCDRVATQVLSFAQMRDEGLPEQLATMIWTRTCTSQPVLVNTGYCTATTVALKSVYDAPSLTPDELEVATRISCNNAARS